MLAVPVADDPHVDEELGSPAVGDAVSFYSSKSSVGGDEPELGDTAPLVLPLFAKETPKRLSRAPVSALSRMLRAYPPPPRRAPQELGELADKQGAAQVFVCVFPTCVASDVTESMLAHAVPIEFTVQPRVEMGFLLQEALRMHFHSPDAPNLLPFEMRALDGPHIDSDFPPLGEDMLLCDADVNSFVVVLKKAFAERGSSGRTSRSSLHARASRHNCCVIV